MTPSPCDNVCRMDPGRGLCIGCYRTLEEIARWSAMPERERAQVLVRVVERRAAQGPLGTPTRRTDPRP